MTLLFLSNCYGEDRCAATIGRELKKFHPELEIWGAPLLSDGKEYTRRGIPVLTRGMVPPSGGFPMKSLKGFFQDLPFLKQYTHYLRSLKEIRGKVDQVLVVGDVTLLLIAHFALKKPTIFFSIAKSDYLRPHWAIEKWVMKRYPQKVLTRDEYTAQNLRKEGVNAQFLGNPMMDDLTPTGIDWGPSPIIGILPGSREEAYENFRKILIAIEPITFEATFPCALPSTLDLPRIIAIARDTGYQGEGNAYQKDTKKLLLLTNAFPDIISSSDLIIGLAGTANEQAAGLGKPVITFAGTGPQTTTRRMKDQERLLGGAAKYMEDFPGAVTEEVRYLLSHPEEMGRRGGIGKEHMGSMGGSERIAKFLWEI